MKIQHNITEKLNIVKQLNEDLNTLGITQRAPEDESIVISEVQNIPDAPEDEGTDDNVKPNTSAKLTFTPVDAETEISMTFKYRRLSLAHVYTKKALSTEDSVMTVLAHDGETLAKVENHDEKVSTKLLSLVELPEMTLDTSVVENNRRKGEKKYSFSATSSNLVVGTQQAKATVRAEDVGEFVDGNDETHYFKDNFSTDAVDSVTELYFPLTKTAIADNEFKDKPKLANAMIDLHDGIISIGENAFANTVTSLDNVDLNKVQEIKANAFKDATTENVSLPETVTSVGNKALGNVTNVEYTDNGISLGYQIAKGHNDSDVVCTNTVVNAAREENQPVIKFVLKSGSDHGFEALASAVTKASIGAETGLGSAIHKVIISNTLPDAFDGFEGLSISRLDLKEVSRIKANTLNDFSGDELILKEGVEVDENAFNNTDINTIRVATKEQAEALAKMAVFKAPHLTNTPKYYLYEGEEEIVFSDNIPPTVSSTGFTYE